MQGMRVVRNLIVGSSVDLTNGSYTKLNAGTGVIPVVTANAGVAPDGTTTASRVVFDRGAGTALGDVSYLNNGPGSANSAYKPSFYIKSNTASSYVLGCNGGIGNVTFTVTTSWKRISAQGQFEVLHRGTDDANQVADVLIWGCQNENTTGQSVTAPGEYQSVGVLSTPFQGLGVDGAKAYTTTNGNTVASNVVTEATGAVISSAIRQGFLVEAAATDLLTARADARDMTTANWTLGVTMTRARTSVGMDGAANTATRLTGGAVAATNTIITTITAAASSRTYSVGLKRVTGTGTISICQDGVTFTDITSQLNTSTYTVVSITASQLNAQLGIKISTNLDAIDADWNQFEAGALATSRIPTAISTRNADVATIATGSWYNALAGTLYTEVLNPSVSGTYITASIHDGTANNQFSLYSGGTSANFNVDTGGVSQCAINNGALTLGAVAKQINFWQVNDFGGYAQNTTMGTDAVGTIPTVTTFEIGSRRGALQLNSTIRAIRYYPYRLPNEIAKQLTA